ncbi:MAG: Smr/MutS family protein [Deltaproteobacteria bacterium]|nr:Smr/MutS family protein [Deltaproteobacteria bacterium]
MKKKKKKDIFHPAFEGLEGAFKKYPAPATQQQPLKPQKMEKAPEDSEIFVQAMSGVVPLEKKVGIKPSAHGKKTSPPYPAPDVEQEVMDHLRDLVNGTAEMDITFSDEYIEGSISGVDRNTIRRLKRGQIPIQDHIDLHGLTQREAEIRVREFLINSQARGLQCVLIVHGRGLNSPDSIPVLKERLPVWLNRGPARKIVKAFSSARPYDGGTGAIYVLMRRHKAQGTGRKAKEIK